MFAVCQRSAFPLFNDVKSEFVSTGTDFHPGASNIEIGWKDKK